MYDNLESFIQKISNFTIKTSSEMIVYFAYYCLFYESMQQIKAKQIEDCFGKLSIKPYSNVASYLRDHSKGRDSFFIKGKDGYILQRNISDRIKKELDEDFEVVVTDEILPLDILDTAPYYIQRIAKQMNQCFECHLYDATLVMMRKLAETLIIECFERYNKDATIKDNAGQFYYLSDLIPKFVTSNKWNVSRNLEANIRKVKKYGDLSAHNRRFLAKKSDMEEFKFELRQMVQEIILIIDYPNWNREQ